MDPTTFFKNRYMETKKLNDLIIQLKKRKNLVLVKFDKQGIKRFKSGTVQHRFDNKPGVVNFWKEKEPLREAVNTRQGLFLGNREGQ